MYQKRLQLIVYTRRSSIQQKMAQYGHVVYISKKMNYVCLYINEAQKDSILGRIKKLHGVQKVEVTPVTLNGVTEI